MGCLRYMDVGARCMLRNEIASGAMDECHYGIPAKGIFLLWRLDRAIGLRIWVLGGSTCSRTSATELQHKSMGGSSCLPTGRPFRTSTILSLTNFVVSCDPWSSFHRCTLNKILQL